MFVCFLALELTHLPIIEDADVNNKAARSEVTFLSAVQISGDLFHFSLRLTLPRPL